MGSTKLFICGPARHGKDTLADIIYDQYGLSSMSSSRMCMLTFLRVVLENEYGLVYDTNEECFADRVNHRLIWFEEIKAYNSQDLSRLSRLIFSVYNVYVGIRNREEFLASKHLSDLSVWVDAGSRPVEASQGSPGDKLVRESDCDITIKNDGTLEDLKWKTRRLFDMLVYSKGFRLYREPVE